MWIIYLLSQQSKVGVSPERQRMPQLEEPSTIT